MLGLTPSSQRAARFVGVGLVFGAVFGGLVGSRPSEAGALSPVSQAFIAGDCARCHTVPVADVPVATRLDSCTDCHIWIKGVAAAPEKRAVAMQKFPAWPRYEKNVASYLAVPRLDAAMARLEPAWVKAYLRDPHDCRPNLPETMPRFALTDAQIDAIASAFTAARAPVPTTEPPSAARVARGEALFAQKGCISCHTFGGRSTVGALPMAPDLAVTRDRMDPDHVAAWIADPKSVSAGATMPTLGLAADEVLALRDFVLLADPQATPAPALGAPPAPVSRHVTYAEVEERVFGKICRHCHMNPENNQGRAGPGNAGGFGYPATGIELETYEGVVAAAPKIKDALLRRRLEAHRDVVHAGERPPSVQRPMKPGMPLGLPPIPDEDLALVLGWLAQGTPRD
jgi:cytochrome c2